MTAGGVPAVEYSATASCSNKPGESTELVKHRILWTVRFVLEGVTGAAPS